MSSPSKVSHASHPDGARVSFWCPGCDQAHTIGPAWSYDGNDAAPTIHPSIKVEGVQWEPSSGFHKPRHHVEPRGQTICHSFVRSGRIEFLGDCTHDLAGQTVELPDWSGADE